MNGNGSITDFDIICWYGILIFTLVVIKRACSGVYFQEDVQIKGNVMIVTGANSGIGFQTALESAKRGATVILACRSRERGLHAEKLIKKMAKNDCVRFVRLDLASFESIQTFVKTIKNEYASVDVLVNNAGVFWCPFTRTQDGFELNFGVNYLGHFLLTLLLLPLLNQSNNGGRVVNVASIMHIFVSLDLDDLMDQNRQYNFVKAYSESKLANVMFSIELARRLKGVNVKSYCVDPGIVCTDIGRDSPVMSNIIFYVICRPLMWLLFKSAYGGAQTVLYCAWSKTIRYDSGIFYSECEARQPWRSALKLEEASKLWNASMKLTGLTENETNLLIS